VQAWYGVVYLAKPIWLGVIPGNIYDPTGGEMRTNKRVQIIVIGDKAYLPSDGVYPSGLSTGIEPIFVVRPTLEELMPVVVKMANTGPILLPSPTKEDLVFQRNLLPKITKTKSWKRLGQAGILYFFDITENWITLEISRLDDKGRWEFDKSKQKRYPVNTDLSEVVQDILDDLKSRQGISPIE
jgi:hypothetical protein